MPSRGTRWVAAAGGVLMLGVLQAGCTADPDSPVDDAEAFTQALGDGDLTGVALTGTRPRRAQQGWERTREGMGEAELAVEVADVAEGEGDNATATLSHTWDLPGTSEPWTYETQVDLVRTDERWAVAFEPSAAAPGLRPGERLRLTRLAPERGDLTGAGGRVIVTERPVRRLGIDKTLVDPARQAASARALARLLDVGVDDLAQRVEAAGDRAFVEAIVLREEDVTSRIAEGVESIEGARAVDDELPLAPTREFARPILGTVGAVTAEVVEESDGFYAPGDVGGLSGLQARYDERLRGTPGALVEAVPDQGDPRELFRTDPRAGEPLRLALDVETQQAAERVLADVGPASAVVALRASTGEILAAASGPGSAGYSTATIGQYAPGSTFKVVSSLALLRSGVSVDDPLPCPATTAVDGKQFENYDDYPADALGPITLRTALASSCNTAFVSQHERVDASDLAGAAAALGFGQDHDLGFPAFLGALPVEPGSSTEHAAGLIGQGKVLASPLAMASVAASVAAGRTVVPRLVAGTEVEASPPTSLTTPEADRLGSLMAGVVRGGSAAFLADVPGPRVLAKTGTAEFGDEDPPRTHAWMVAAQGDVAVAVFVEAGESGSRTAGPLLEELLRSLG